MRLIRFVWSAVCPLRLQRCVVPIVALLAGTQLGQFQITWQLVLALAALVQFLQGVLVDDLEHPVADLTIGALSERTGVATSVTWLAGTARPVGESIRHSIEHMYEVRACVRTNQGSGEQMFERRVGPQPSCRRFITRRPTSSKARNAPRLREGISEPIRTTGPRQDGSERTIAIDDLLEFSQQRGTWSFLATAPVAVADGQALTLGCGVAARWGPDGQRRPGLPDHGGPELVRP